MDHLLSGTNLDSRTALGLSLLHPQTKPIGPQSTTRSSASTRLSTPETPSPSQELLEPDQNYVLSDLASRPATSRMGTAWQTFTPRGFNHRSNNSSNNSGNINSFITGGDLFSARDGNMGPTSAPRNPSMLAAWRLSSRPRGSPLPIRLQNGSTTSGPSAATLLSPVHIDALGEDLDPGSFGSHASKPSLSSSQEGAAVGAVNKRLDNSHAYCYSRGNGQYTPLIPADLLPPAVLARMQLSALQQGSEGLIVLPMPRGRVHDSLGADVGSVVTPGQLCMPPTPLSPEYPINGSANDAVQAQINAIVASQAPKKVKTHCTKWIHEGICSFAQTGCKFKHEMPMDKAGQHAVGLYQGLPTWWKKRQAELARVTFVPANNTGAVAGNGSPVAGCSPASYGGGSLADWQMRKMSPTTDVDEQMRLYNEKHEAAMSAVGVEQGGSRSPWRVQQDIIKTNGAVQNDSTGMTRPFSPFTPTTSGPSRFGPIAPPSRNLTPISLSKSIWAPAVESSDMLKNENAISTIYGPVGRNVWSDFKSFHN